MDQGMPECKGWWGRTFGHRFEHVYDEVKGTPTLAQFTSERRGPGISGIDTSPTMMEVLEASRPIKRNYVYSICRRCGHRVYRHVDVGGDICGSR